MTATLGVRETLTTLLTRVKALVPLESGALFLAGDDGLLRCAAADGLDPATLRILPIDDDQAAPVCALRLGKARAQRGPGTRSVAGGRRPRHGVAQLAGRAPGRGGPRRSARSRSTRRRTTPSGARMPRVMERAADFAGAAISKAMQFDQAHTDSLTDALTGLPNARFLTMHLTQELARATRLGSQVALLVIDIDDFKRINDSAGHHVGDRVLREVGPRAARERPRLRRVRALRRGRVRRDAARVRRRRGRRPPGRSWSRRSARVSVEAGERRLRVRASVGAAVFPLDGRTFEALLAAADRRMYENKARAKAHRPHRPGCRRARAARRDAPSRPTAAAGRPAPSSQRPGCA